jgi:hypothetical protein
VDLVARFENKIRKQRAENKRKPQTVKMLEKHLRGVPGADRFTLESIYESPPTHYVTLATHPAPDCDPGDMMGGVLQVLKHMKGWTMEDWERIFSASPYKSDDNIRTSIQATLRATRETNRIQVPVVTFTELGKPPACEVTSTPIEERTQSIHYKKTVICTDPLTGEETRVEVT